MNGGLESLQESLVSGEAAAVDGDLLVPDAYPGRVALGDVAEQRVTAGRLPNRTLRASRFNAAIRAESSFVTPMRMRPSLPFTPTEPSVAIVTTYGPWTPLPPNANGGHCDT